MTTLFNAFKFVFIVLSFISKKKKKKKEKKKVFANYSIAFTHDNMLLLIFLVLVI